MFAIDIFSKKLAVIPMVGKSSAEAARALTETIEQKLGFPVKVHTDEGG